MNKKINPKSIVMEESTTLLIFLYPSLVFIGIIFYTINNFNYELFLILIIITILLFLPAFMGFYEKKLILTKNSIYVFVRNKKVFSSSLINDFYLLDIKQDKLSKIFNYGTLIIVNKDKKYYEYFFLSNINNIKEKITIRYEKNMKRIDPTFIQSYILSKEKEQKQKEKIDVIEDKNET